MSAQDEVPHPVASYRSIAERRGEAAALVSIARLAGIAVQADDFGRGTFLFSDVACIERILDAAKRQSAAELTRLRTALADLVRRMRALRMPPTRHFASGVINGQRVELRGWDEEDFNAYTAEFQAALAAAEGHAS